MIRARVALRLIVPGLWFGLVLGLSFIEAPLKFLAPGITIPLGLGIGRLVFIALGIAGWVLFASIVVLGFGAPRRSAAEWWTVAVLGVVLAVESFLIRPALAARSDIIIAGGDPGESWLHYGYIAADVLILALLVAIMAQSSRRLRAD